jgi:hypothetical protein
MGLAEPGTAREAALTSVLYIRTQGLKSGDLVGYTL